MNNNEIKSAKVTEYEHKIIRLLCSEALPDLTLNILINKPEKVTCQFTGTGYYLDITHSEIPTERIVCDKPFLSASYQGKEIGFLIFIEKQILTLECYNLCNKDFPAEIRNNNIVISY